MIKAKDTNSLIEIAFVNPRNHQPEIVDQAVEELKLRNIEERSSKVINMLRSSSISDDNRIIVSYDPDESEEADEDEIAFNNLLTEVTPRLIFTPVLVIMNLFIFIAMIISGISIIEPTADEIFRWGATYAPATTTGDWWRLLTSAFIHIGIMHLLFNMWVLWDIGSLAERLFGNWSFIFLYLFSGIGGSVVSTLFNPDIVSAGASGAIFGIAGGTISFLLLGNLDIPKSRIKKRLKSVLLFVGYNIFHGLTNTGIDNAGHIGGLIFGLIAGLLLCRTLRDGVLIPKLKIPFSVGILSILTITQIFLITGRTTSTEIADYYFQDGQFDKAIAEYEASLEKNPSNHDARNDLGVAYLNVGSYKKAANEFQKIIDINPEHEFAKNNIGIAYANIGDIAFDNQDYEEALIYYKKLLEIYPDNLELYNRLGFIYNKYKRFDDAINEFQKVLRINPMNEIALISLGLAYLGNEDIESSIEVYGKMFTLEKQVSNNQSNDANWDIQGEKDAVINKYLEEINIDLQMENMVYQLFESIPEIAGDQFNTQIIEYYDFQELRLLIYSIFYKWYSINEINAMFEFFTSIGGTTLKEKFGLSEFFGNTDYFQHPDRTIIPDLHEYFTAEEVEALVNLFSTPIGQSIEEKSGIAISGLSYGFALLAVRMEESIRKAEKKVLDKEVAEEIELSNTLYTIAIDVYKYHLEKSHFPYNIDALQQFSNEVHDIQKKKNINLISSIFLESGNYQLNLNTQGMSISIYVEPPILNYKSYTKDITIGGYVNHTLNKDSKWVMTLSDYADLVESHKSKFAKEFQKSKKGINDTENGNETTIPDFTPCDVLPEPVGGLERLFNRVVYPDSAIIEGIEGQVFVRVYVDEDGFIQKTEILKGIPDSGLDQAAIDAINKTYFLPGELNGKSVGAWVSLPFTFKLQDE